jgi:hypothetical protein
VITIPIALLVLLGLVCARLAMTSAKEGDLGRFPAKEAAALAAGPARIEGTLRALDARLEAIDGTAAVFVRTRIDVAIETDDSNYTLEGALAEVASVPAEIVDATGACRVDTGGALRVIGEARAFTAEVSAFRARYPELWARVAVADPATVRSVTVHQTVVPDGAAGLAAGEAREFPDAGALVLGAAPDAAMWLVTMPEARLRSLLLRPVLLYAGLALVSAAAAGGVAAFAYLVSV